MDSSSLLNYKHLKLFVSSSREHEDRNDQIHVRREEENEGKGRRREGGGGDEMR